MTYRTRRKRKGGVSLMAALKYDGEKRARVFEGNQRGLEDKEERKQVVVGVAMRGFTPLA
jgi:hypothetical protein